MKTLPIELNEAEAQRLMILAQIDARQGAEALRFMARVEGREAEKTDMQRCVSERQKLFVKLADFSFNFPVVDQPGK